MTHKPNRVHKATGIIAEWCEVAKCYDLYKNGDHYNTLPAEIVEGEGWEEEKSEIDELVNAIEAKYGRAGRGDLANLPRRVELMHLILEFAKKYKEQKS